MIDSIRKQFREHWWAHVVLIVAVGISVFPALRIFAVALRPGDSIFSASFELWPSVTTSRHYGEVFAQTEFVQWLVNSLVVTFCAAVIGVSLSATCAYALSRHKFRGKSLMLLFLMATQMIPAVMFLLPLYFMLRQMNLINTYAGVIVAYTMTTLPFCIWLLKGYFDSVPRSLEEAARIDGLSEIGSFWRIVIPLSTPSLAIAMLFCVVQAWNEYIVARVVLQSSEMYTWPLGIYELQGDFDTRWGMFAAASVLVTVPVLFCFLYSSKWLLKGLTLGSVKG